LLIMLGSNSNLSTVDRQ
jgi:hypothetical protein